MLREELMKPAITKALKEKQRALRKQKLRYSVEDAIHEATVEVMAAEGMPVTFAALKAAYRNKSKYKSKR